MAWARCACVWRTIRPSSVAAQALRWEARAKGIIRAHGVSCHDFGALKRCADVPWVDVVLARINPGSAHMDAKTDEVVPVLRDISTFGKLLGILGAWIVQPRRPPELLEAGGRSSLDAQDHAVVHPVRQLRLPAEVC